MRVAFFGTPQVAVPSLEALVGAGDVHVAAVITNPDRPRGRHGTPVPPPVKRAAQAHGLEVWQPTKPADMAGSLQELGLDAGAVVAYGAILPPQVLRAAGHGLVNLHFSLLPRWRGAAPVQHALRAGDRTTGITTFVLDEGMDTGPILARQEVAIDPDESAGELLARLAALGAPLLLDSLRRLVAGEEPTPQPDEGATLAPKVTPDDVRLDWGATAGELVDLARSADPAPGAHTTWRGQRLKVLRAVPVEVADGDPGRIVRVDRDGPVVACGRGAVRLEVVQPEGRQRMDGTAFVNGYRPQIGERLGRGG